MKPIKFEEANKNLLKPSDMTDEECSSLWVNTDGVVCISCWQMFKALQSWLNATFKAGLAVDGVYGSKTKAAVRVLKKGAIGNGVKILQGFLICNGYDTGGFDDDFGSKTDAAVRSYQGKKGITVDGQAGQNTFAKLAAQH